MSASEKPAMIHLDAAIVGGGIAGAWLLNLLRRKGYSAVLLERDALGVDQTLASQGMIHGGLKYALGGNLTGASEAIATMPQRWRDCLAGKDPVNLEGTQLLSERYYMFAAGSILGRMTTFFASKALRGRIDKLPRAQWPAAFDGFDGVVYALNDFVLDVPDLLNTLTRPWSTSLLKFDASSDNISACDGGFVCQLDDQRIKVNQLISCAGNGSQRLIKELGISGIEVQHRPLKQVIVEAPHAVALYAHCLTGVTRNEPRLTITSRAGPQGMVWYLGGELAEDTTRTDQQQIDYARRELAHCIPWLDWHGASYRVLHVDRAEPMQSSGLKPDEAYVTRQGAFIQCFPTKLTLTPDLGDKVLACLDPPIQPADLLTTHPTVTVGPSPW